MHSLIEKKKQQRLPLIHPTDGHAEKPSHHSSLDMKKLFQDVGAPSKPLKIGLDDLEKSVEMFYSSEQQWTMIFDIDGLAVRKVLRFISVVIDFEVLM